MADAEKTITRPLQLLPNPEVSINGRTRYTQCSVASQKKFTIFLYSTQRIIYENMSMGQKEYRIRPPELCPFMQRNDSIGGRMGHTRRVVSVRSRSQQQLSRGCWDSCDTILIACWAVQIKLSHRINFNSSLIGFTKDILMCFNICTTNHQR